MTDVRAFVRSYLGVIGATVEPGPRGSLVVRWPPTHVPTFGPATTLTFDRPDAADPDAELCVLGSDVFDRILEDASKRGFHCVARVEAEGEPPPEAVLEANLQFPNASTEVVASDRGVLPYLLFNFHVSFVTDEKREYVRSILLNAETLNEHHVADVFLQESLTLPEEPVVGGADLGRAYRAACHALEWRLVREAETVRSGAETRLAGELERIAAYYDASIEELYRGRSRAPLEAERVLRAERGRREDDARRKYAFAAEARLVNVRTILIPTTMVRARVANPRASKLLSLEYDAVNLDVEAACDACSTRVPTLYLCRRGHVACEACRVGCSMCDDVACRTCAPTTIATCETCVAAICPDHTFLDEIGRKAYCGDHIHTCAICGRGVGAPYLQECSLCAQSYCAVCVGGQTGRCETCRGLEVVPASHPDVAAAVSARGAPRGASQWLRAENGRYVVVVGRAKVFQHLVVLTRNGAVVHRRKGIGLVRERRGDPQG